MIQPTEDEEQDSLCDRIQIWTPNNKSGKEEKGLIWILLPSTLSFDGIKM